jgi:proteasome lid subunit RPN8/RPN11
MVEFDVGFRRSRAIRGECKEFSVLSRLKLSEVVQESIERHREFAFGAVVTDEKVQFTENVRGNRHSVDMRTIKSIYDSMEDIEVEGSNRRECLIHTHPGSPDPSAADMLSVANSLTTRFAIEDRAELPNFDCYFIAGRENREGKLIGFIIEERPKASVGFGTLQKVTNEVQQARADSDVFPDEVSEKARDVLMSLAGEYIFSCEATFDFDKPPGV